MICWGQSRPSKINLKGGGGGGGEEGRPAPPPLLILGKCVNFSEDPAEKGHYAS